MIRHQQNRQAIAVEMVFIDPTERFYEGKSRGCYRLRCGGRR
jgi:hypothetical protein